MSNINHLTNFFQDLPKLVGENDSENDSDEELWIEIDEEAMPTISLFDAKEYVSIEEAIADMKKRFNFDLAEMKQKHSMDFYSFMKMINFIRHKSISAPAQLYSDDGSPLWLDDAYLKPSGDFESWMSYDFDQLSLNETKELDEAGKLLKMIEDLKAQLEIKDQQLLQAADDKEKMRDAFKHMMSKESEPVKNVVIVKKKHENGVASVSLDDDSGYFESYSHFNIHHTMLSDKVRTESYRDAIIKNSAVMNGKTVMDLGCGTAILSMFASQAGAKTVYAVDQSEIIYQAMEIAQTNKFENIKFVKGRLEDVEFPAGKVDVIISEWMGYLLLFEGMLDSVIYARNNYLKEGGLLLPNRCTISLVGYGSQDRYGKFVEFFHDVYGFDMKCMLKDILREGHVEKCEDAHVLTKPNTICDLDLMTCNLNYSNFSFDFNLEVTKDSKLNSFVGYFDTFFELSEKVSFSTSPAADPTHWQQVVFYLDQPVDVKVGDVIKGNFVCRRDKKDLRSLNIEIKVFDKLFKYDLN